MPEVKTVPRSPQLGQLADWFRGLAEDGYDELATYTVIAIIERWLPPEESIEESLDDT